MKLNDDKYLILVLQSAHNWYILLFSSLFFSLSLVVFFVKALRNCY